jgi:hypothetical protein
MNAETFTDDFSLLRALLIRLAGEPQMTTLTTRERLTALRLLPDYADRLQDLGVTMRDIRRYEEALRFGIVQ